LGIEGDRNARRGRKKRQLGRGMFPGVQPRKKIGMGEQRSRNLQGLIKKNPQEFINSRRQPGGEGGRKLRDLFSQKVNGREPKKE